MYNVQWTIVIIQCHSMLFNAVQFTLNIAL